MNWIRRPIGSSARLRSGREVFTRVFWSINMCIRGLCYHSTLSPPRKWLSYGFLMMLCISHKTAITNALFRLKLRLGNHLNLAITERVCQLLCGDYCKNISMSESKTSSFKRLKSLPVKSSHRKGLWLTVNKFFIVILSLHYCKWLTVLFCEIRISSCQLDIRFRNITSDWVLSQWDKSHRSEILHLFCIQQFNTLLFKTTYKWGTSQAVCNESHPYLHNIYSSFHIPY